MHLHRLRSIFTGMNTVTDTTLAIIAPVWAQAWLRQLVVQQQLKLYVAEANNASHPDILLFLVPTHPALFDRQLQEWQERWPSSKLIGWTAAHRPDETEIFRMLNAGVHAVLPETADGDDLKRACHDVLNGDIHLNCHVTGAMLHFLRRQQVLRSRPHDGMLSTRECKMVELRRDGKTAEEIADQLCLSRKTVDKLFCEMYRRTGSRNFFELLRTYERRQYQPWASPGSTEPLPATNSLR